jgi:RNA polymerase sigma-70 factor (ECF subfamily)
MLAIKQGFLPERTAVESSPESDMIMLERVAGRDKAAFKHLYRKYHGQIYRLLLRLFHQPQLAEEVVNDAMFVVWEKAATFRGQSKVSTWIIGIAYRRGLTSFKRRRRYQDMEQAEESMDAFSGEEQSTPASKLEDAEFNERIRRGLNTLSEPHRSVVELTLLGYSYSEIALIVDCPVNTVKTRMFHARRQLREFLSTGAGAQSREVYGKRL